MSTQTIHQEKVVLPASWFNKVEYRKIAGVPVIIAHWTIKIGSQIYPMQQVICTSFQETILYPSETIQRLVNNKVLTISSIEGINVKITENSRQLRIVEIWE